MVMVGSPQVWRWRWRWIRVELELELELDAGDELLLLDVVP